MKSVATTRFWRCYEALPTEIQLQAERAFRLWSADPSHRSIDFKQVHATRPVYSARIGRHWRALGLREGDTIAWYWIGSHADYDQLLARL